MTILKKIKLKLVCVAVILACCLSAGAANCKFFTPQMFLSGYGGYDGWEALGKADVLAPVFLRNNKLAFLYGQGRYGDGWTGSLGAGYRQIYTLFNYQSILGGYIFTDYSKTTTEHNVTDLSFGVESLGFVWDVRINGYFPIGETQWKTEDWADNFDDYSYIVPKGHSIYDAKFVFYEETGAGADAEIGRNLLIIHNMLLKGFVDGYYYHMPHNNEMLGAGLKFTLYPTSYLEVSLNDTYDNYNHNVIMAGFRVSINKLINRFRFGAAEAKDGLQYRLQDPIERNFGAIGSGSTIPTAGGPGRSKPEVILPDVPPSPGPTPPNQWYQHNAPEKDNVWFFSNVATNDAADGTYENPYSASYLTQQTLTDINTYSQQHGKNYADCYLNPRITIDLGDKPLELYAGESIWGRMGDHKGYQEPAEGDNRPLFVGALKLSGGNNIIDSIILQGKKTEFNNGIYIQNAANITLNNLSVGAAGNYITAIYLDHATNVNLNASYVKSGRLDTTGGRCISNIIQLQNNSSLNIKDNNIIIRDLTVPHEPRIDDIEVSGILMQNSDLVISGCNNQISSTLTGGDMPGGAFNRGIQVNNGHITINGSNNSILVENNTTHVGGPLQLTGITANSSEVTISGDNNTISCEAEHSFAGDTEFMGIILDKAATNKLTITGKHNVIAVATKSQIGMTDDCGGIFAMNGQINIANTEFDVGSAQGHSMMNPFAILLGKDLNPVNFTAHGNNFIVNGDPRMASGIIGSNFTQAQINQLKHDNTFDGTGLKNNESHWVV